MPSKVLVDSLVILKIFRKNDLEMCFPLYYFSSSKKGSRSANFVSGWVGKKKKGLDLGLFSSENRQTNEAEM